MLLAHGAIPNIPDKSGDTPESYAAEWENVECVRILQEATAAKHAADMDEINDMFDSEGSEDSDDDDDDDDESSMMNYIMPPPMAPKTNVAPPPGIEIEAILRPVIGQFSPILSSHWLKLENVSVFISFPKIRIESQRQII